MKTYFEQKVVIITGSSTGIGKSLAILLGAYGAKIVLNARNPEKLAATEQELKRAAIDVIGIAADVTVETECVRLINSALQHFGKIDVLVNNAGVSMRGNLAHIVTKVVSDIFNINAIAPIILSQLALPYIKQSKGSLVFISSLAGLRGLPDISIYSASKMSLNAIAGSLRVEHYEDEIHIGLIYVGITEIEIGKTAIGHDGSDVLLNQRKGLFTNSTLEVAKKIAENIAVRKKQTVIGFSGKIYFLLVRYFPELVEFLLIRSQKKMKKLYK